MLGEHGLAAALDGLVARSPIPVDVRVTPERAAPAVEAAIYFTIAEALTNVAKYAQATKASITIEIEDGTLVAEVTDDGVGGASMTAGSGLRGLEDRLDAIGGTLTVHSRPGKGTTIRACAPLGHVRVTLRRFAARTASSREASQRRSARVRLPRAWACRHKSRASRNTSQTARGGCARLATHAVAKRTPPLAPAEGAVQRTRTAQELRAPGTRHRRRDTLPLDAYPRHSAHSPWSTISCSATSKATRAARRSTARSSSSSAKGCTSPQRSQTMW